jgi:hypothetical protein
MQKSNKNVQTEEEIVKLKKELDMKYVSMNFLKDQVKKKNQTDATEEMKMKMKEHEN